MVQEKLEIWSSVRATDRFSASLCTWLSLVAFWCESLPHFASSAQGVVPSLAAASFDVVPISYLIDVSTGTATLTIPCLERSVRGAGSNLE
jgi:hypothetical protein